MHAGSGMAVLRHSRELILISFHFDVILIWISLDFTFTSFVLNWKFVKKINKKIALKSGFGFAVLGHHDSEWFKMTLVLVAIPLIVHWLENVTDVQNAMSLVSNTFQLFCTTSISNETT